MERFSLMEKLGGCQGKVVEEAGNEKEEMGRLVAGVVEVVVVVVE